MFNVLNDQLADLFSGIHLLPFYYPIDGSDAGFDPIDHTQVDSRLGNWNDIKVLGEGHELMADLIVNHMSAKSKEFQSVLQYGKESPYWDLFLTKDKVFPNGLSSAQQEQIYRPRPGSCFTNFPLPNNESADFWTTFTDNQIDIDVNSNIGKEYLLRILKTFSENNIKSLIRLSKWALYCLIDGAFMTCMEMWLNLPLIGSHQLKNSNLVTNILIFQKMNTKSQKVELGIILKAVVVLHLDHYLILQKYGIM